MRIGVICEGQTDFFAIREFLSDSLRRSNIPVQFVDLQPDFDNTQVEAGWGNIERWLSSNNPDLRVRRFLRGPLFDSGLDKKNCDCFLIQMDVDILDDPGFVDYNRNNYGLVVSSPNGEAARYSEVVKILSHWSSVGLLSNEDSIRHIFAPAVESTEAWCVAAFSRTAVSPSRLRGDNLRDAFMDALHQSEARPKRNYKEINKSAPRRKVFCEKHASGSGRIIQNCFDFRRMHYEAHGIYMLFDSI